MGKAAERRKSRREKYLAGLAKSSPDKFHAEWHKRMDSWLHEVHRRTRDLVDNEERTLPSAFGVVTIAQNALKEAGINPAALEEHNSINMLTHACICSVASLHGRELYHLNVIVEKRE